MRRLRIRKLGPIEEADITFGDLTVLVGPQASGKSLFVQTYKALRDKHAIHEEFASYGYSWGRNEAVGKFSTAYFGGGYSELMNEHTILRADSTIVTSSGIALPRSTKTPVESVYLIPAQRVLVLAEGWPGRFMSYPGSDPYCLKHFGESIRLLMENELGDQRAIFPQDQRLKKGLRTLLESSVYPGATLRVETQGGRKRILLHRGKSSLPSGVWSAGQREFTPLLIGLLWLLPSSKMKKRDSVDTVVIEEPEMGLHPQAIVTVVLLILELMARGYKVVVSTHSPVVLDVVWAIRELRSALSEDETTPKKSMAALRTIFGTTSNQQEINGILKTALKAEYRTYYFRRDEDGVRTMDISSLDPAHDDFNISGWGGLSGFSGDIADAVGEALS